LLIKHFNGTRNGWISEFAVILIDSVKLSLAEGVAIGVGVVPKVSDIVQFSEALIFPSPIESVKSSLPNNKCEN
jgi:hypothetical protein